MTLLCFTAKKKINLKKLDYSGWLSNTVAIAEQLYVVHNATTC